MKTLIKILGIFALGLHLSAGFAGAEDVLINGAGATFPYPIYSKWFDEYHKLKPDLKFNYQSIGSGGGIRQIMAQTVDFGASDSPMKDTDMESAPGFLFHIPTVLGAVVVTYNIPAVTGNIKLTQAALSKIFLGTINKWNDPEIQKDNPGISFPDQPIIVVHRSDGSGTSSIFTDFLAKVSLSWSTKVGRGTSVAWPTGLGGKGNEGVVGLIKLTPYSIGYCELIYAQSNKLPIADIQNKAGKFITPSLGSVTAAAQGKIPSDFRVSITNCDAAAGYPISGFTWLLVYEKQKNAVKGKALVGFLHWMLKDGQKLAGDLGYAPLPENVNQMVEKAIMKIKVQ